jgi:hypothetical protein
MDTADQCQLRRWADLVVVAPCSADMLAKIAGGHCDNLAVSYNSTLSGQQINPLRDRSVRTDMIAINPTCLTIDYTSYPLPSDEYRHVRAQIHR